MKYIDDFFKSALETQTTIFKIWIILETLVLLRNLTATGERINAVTISIVKGWFGFFRVRLIYNPSQSPLSENPARSLSINSYLIGIFLS